MGESTGINKKTGQGKKQRYDPGENRMFTRRQIYQLMLPLIIEQLLTVTVGIADSKMVSVAGEAAVSGVSLVDAINNLVLSVLAALATGGAVVCSQYLGKRDKDSACQAANQLVLTTTTIALAIMLILLIGGRHLLRLIFGATEDSVMNQAVTYCVIIVFTYPFMAIYNSAAALLRSMGNSRVSMLVSLLMNLINIAGNAILIFGLNMGVAGAAIATVISRIVGSFLLLGMAHQKRYEVHVSGLYRVRPHWQMIRRILYIGIPTGLENGIFQLGKLIVLSLISSFGTASIMANSVGSMICQFMILPGVATSLAIVTVVGQCIGAGEVKQARYYTNRLILLSTIMMAVVSAGIVLLRPFLLGLYNMSPEAYKIANTLIFWHFIAGLIWPLSFNLPNALRAAGDVKYTMVIGMLSMWIFRVGSSYLLGGMMGYGVYGVWLAMFLDWFVRVICLLIRYHGDKWHQKKLV